MLTKEHILKVLREELPVVAERFGVTSLALFWWFEKKRL